MAAVSTSAEKKPFELSRVGALTFDLLRREFVTDYGLAVAIAALPAILSFLETRPYLQALRAQLRSPGVVAPHTPQIFSLTYLLLSLIGLLSILLIYGVLSWGAVERLEGRTPTLGEKLSAAVRALPVLTGVAILAYFAFVFASILLLIPGLILVTMWALLVPSAVTEKIGVFATFRRSSELTRGHRWSIFLLLLIFWLGSLMVSLLSLALEGAIFGVSVSFFLPNLTGPASYIVLAVGILIGGLFHVVGGVGVGVAYHELRRSNGEYDSRSLGDVFA